MVWNEMKNFVRDQLCETPEAVSNAIENFRQTLIPQKYENYIRKLHEVKYTLKLNLFHNFCINNIL